MFFFKKPALGINISDYSVELVGLEKSRGAIQLSCMGRVLLSPGIGERGQVKDRKRLETALQNLFEHPQFGNSKSTEVILSLPEHQCFLHSLEREALALEGDLQERIHLEIAKTFPLKASELSTDYLLKNNRLLIAAIPTNVLKEYEDTLLAAGLKPVGAEPESLSLARALVDDSSRATLIVDLGAWVTTLAFFSSGFLKMTFSVERGGNHFTKAIGDHLHIPFERAERLKQHFGLDPAKEKGRVFFILQKELQKVLEEIQRTSAYFTSKEGESVPKIILTGGNAAIPKLAEYFSDNLSQKVEIGDPWRIIDIAILRKREFYKEALRINPILYAPAIGAALRGLERNPAKVGINLLSTSL